MKHPAIYETFQRKESTSDGISVYDFLGGKIDARFKHDWERNLVPEGSKITPGYPALSEWTADWVASLLAAKTAGSHFNIVELGAGYGQWMVTGLLAFNAIRPAGTGFGIAVEADLSHYEWLKQNVESNLGGLPNLVTELVHGAAGLDGSVTFPVVEDPSKDYGASYSLAGSYEKTIEVPSFSLDSLCKKLPKGKIDMLHVDIQGAEVDLIESDNFQERLADTRVVLFGTHRSTELHNSVRNKLQEAGLVIKLEWPRNGTVNTDFGVVKTNDGALLAMDVSTSNAADQLMSFSNLGPL
jgi:FkbM family methyltransferase